VLQTNQTVDTIVCRGDIVGVLGWPRECVRHVREACSDTVIRNRDRAVLPRMDVTAASQNGVSEFEYGS
jgi:hypothetical protein